MFVENILKPYFKHVSDAKFLHIIKGTVVVF